MKKEFTNKFKILRISLKIIFYQLVILTVLSFFAACEQKPENPVEKYRDLMIDSYKKGQEAREKANLYALRSAVQAYYASNGKYPESLEDVESLIDSKVDFSKYDYNPENGFVSLKSN